MRKQYGFTLVELIVAVAILGITAAITTPALTGYLDKGSEQKAVAEAHACVAAAESLATQRLMEGTLEGWADWDGSPPDAGLTGFRHEGQGYYVKTGGGQQPAGARSCAEVTEQAQTPGTVTQLWCNGDGRLYRGVRPRHDKDRGVGASAHAGTGAGAHTQLHAGPHGHAHGCADSHTHAEAHGRAYGNPYTEARRAVAATGGIQRDRKLAHFPGQRDRAAGEGHTAAGQCPGQLCDGCPG